MSENIKATSSPKTPAAKFGGAGLNVGIVVAAILTVVGLVLWGIQLSGGMIQTNMRNMDSWGIYITMFMFFVGLSAGGLIISSIPRAFGMKGFGGISKIAVWTSITCTCLAIGYVVVDLGGPFRVWELFVYSNLGSPLMWDIIVLFVYLILSIVYLWATLRHEAGKVSATALRVVSFIALVCAVLVHSVTAWIFSLQQAHDMWHTALMAPWFVSSALVCGTGLVMIVVIALRAIGYLKLDQAYLVKMAKMLGAFVCVDLYFFGCDLLTEVFPQGEGAGIVSMLVSGQLAPFFWLEVIGCAIAAVICFVPQLRSNAGLIIAAALAIIGIFCKRFQLLVGGFQQPNLDYAVALTPTAVTNYTGGMDAAFAGLVYTPTMLELGIVVGVLGLGALILLLGLKFLPLKPVED